MVIEGAKRFFDSGFRVFGESVAQIFRCQFFAVADDVVDPQVQEIGNAIKQGPGEDGEDPENGKTYNIGNIFHSFTFLKAGKQLHQKFENELNRDASA